MQAVAKADQSNADAGADAGVFRAVKSLRLPLPIRYAPVCIFVVALAARLWFNLLYCQHRISDIGDGYLYLVTGNKLLALIEHSHCIADLVSHLGSHGHAQLDGLLTTTSLVDRLLLDGPIYPSYLCFVQWLLGVPGGAVNFAVFTKGLTTFYSCVDSLTCMLIFAVARLAFNRRAALIAGLLYAFYPPAIINTANSFSEPFAAFCLTGFLLLLFYAAVRRRRGRLSPALWASLGAAAGVTMLVRSLFVVMPAALALVLASLLYWRSIKLRSHLQPGEINARPGGERSTGVGKDAAIAVDGTEPAVINALPGRERGNGPGEGAAVAGGGRPGAKRERKFVAGLVAAAFGLFIVVAPYLVFTWWQTGKPSFVSRAPGYNISMGNQLDSDGWISYSPQFMAADARQAIAHVLRDASHHPLNFLSLYLRKFARLWGGAWNDYQFDLLLSPDWQDVWHQIILLSTACGAWWLLREPKPPTRIFCCGLTLAAACILHCLYVCFIPMSRYAFTAMPAALALAAFAWSSLADKRYRRRFAPWAICLVAMCVLKKLAPFLVPYLMAPGLSYGQAQVADALVWVLIWLSVCGLMVRMAACACSRPAKLAAVALAAGGSALSLALSLGNPSAHEWYAQLSAGQSVRRDVYLPPLPANEACVIVADCASVHLAPSLGVVVNGHRLPGVWIPWLQTRAGEQYQKYLEVLSLQSHASGVPMYSFRQWWVTAVPRSVLSAASNNEVLLTSSAGGDTVYGDYLAPEARSRVLPSLYNYSYMKAFVSIDRGDSRFYDLTAPGRDNASAFYDGTRWRTDDLSAGRGRQTGDYRIFLALSSRQPSGERLPVAPVPVPVEHKQVLASVQQATVKGSNPYSFLLAKVESLPSPAIARENQSLVSTLTCEVKGNRNCGSGFIDSQYSGITNDGPPLTTSLPWHVESFATTSQWNRLSLNDVVPPAVQAMRHCSLSVTAAPFHPDLLFLQHSDAVKRRMDVRNLSIDWVVVPLSPNNDAWSLY